MNMVNAENAEDTYSKYHKDSLIEEYLQKRNTTDVEKILINELEKRGIYLENINQFVRENDLDNFPNNLTYANLALRADRAMACLLDYFYILFFCIILLLAGWIGIISYEISFSITALGNISYALLKDSLPNGQSFGKKSMRIKVISSKTGENCSVAQSIIRNILILIPFLNIIDFVHIGRYKRQRVGDVIAGTMAINDY
jgi:uncharacterized RDD family membrane protein YckC